MLKEKGKRFIRFVYTEEQYTKKKGLNGQCVVEVEDEYTLVGLFTRSIFTSGVFESKTTGVKIKSNNFCVDVFAPPPLRKKKWIVTTPFQFKPALERHHNISNFNIHKTATTKPLKILKFLTRGRCIRTHNIFLDLFGIVRIKGPDAKGDKFVYRICSNIECEYVDAIYLCSCGCGDKGLQARYCSVDCQRDDWPRHKELIEELD